MHKSTENKYFNKYYSLSIHFGGGTFTERKAYWKLAHLTESFKLDKESTRKGALLGETDGEVVGPIEVQANQAGQIRDFVYVKLMHPKKPSQLLRK
jgi:hypothetical protein